MNASSPVTARTGRTSGRMIRKKTVRVPGAVHDRRLVELARDRVEEALDQPDLPQRAAQQHEHVAGAACSSPIAGMTSPISVNIVNSADHGEELREHLDQQQGEQARPGGRVKRNRENA